MDKVQDFLDITPEITDDGVCERQSWVAWHEQPVLPGIERRRRPCHDTPPSMVHRGGWKFQSISADEWARACPGAFFFFRMKRPGQSKAR